MAEEVKIDKQVFHDRLSHFISAWKADKRANDPLFGGVGSIIILMGKNDATITFQKNNAIHVGSSPDELFQASPVSDTIVDSFGCLDMSFLRRYYSSPRKCSTLSQLSKKVPHRHTESFDMRLT